MVLQHSFLRELKVFASMHENVPKSLLSRKKFVYSIWLGSDFVIQTQVSIILYLIHFHSKDYRFTRLFICTNYIKRLNTLSIVSLLV